MGLHVALAGLKSLMNETFCTQLEELPEVERILIASTILEVEYLLPSQHIDLLFTHQSFLEEDVVLSLPTFIIVGETSDIQQSLSAYQRGAKGYILENISEEGLRFVVRSVAQSKGYKFFLDSDT